MKIQFKYFNSHKQKYFTEVSIVLNKQLKEYSACDELVV